MKRLLSVLFGLLVLIGFTPSQLQAADISLSAIPGSARPTVDVDTGELSSTKMTVDVVLAPSNQPELSSLLANLYDSNSASYHQWLGTGEFNSRFAPSNAQIAAVTEYLQASGLEVEQSSSPFIVRASGTSSAVAAAFKTTLRTYRNRKGIA